MEAEFSFTPPLAMSNTWAGLLGLSMLDRRQRTGTLYMCETVACLLLFVSYFCILFDFSVSSPFLISHKHLLSIPHKTHTTLRAYSAGL